MKKYDSFYAGLKDTWEEYLKTQVNRAYISENKKYKNVLRKYIYIFENSRNTQVHPSLGKRRDRDTRLKKILKRLRSDRDKHQYRQTLMHQYL